MKVMRDLVGETLSQRYRLVSRVAGGGMGEVYRGHDLLLDRSVAVKILQPSLASDPVLVERFRAEARAAARLTHPNIVGVHDWGCEGERTYYMVMEYVSGIDLRDALVARGNLLPRQAIDIVVAVCDALQVAHSNALVHRDVKPENILLNRSGEVKVADFGIAIVADADRTSPGGMIPGTLRYLSPEQARGQEASAASDIWAAGAVLSELLTGLPPLQGAGGELLHRRAHEPPRPPSSWDESIPEELDAVVLRACALDPFERYHTAAEMAAALRRIGDDLPVTTPLESLIDEATGEIGLVHTEISVDIGPRRRRGTRRAPRLKSVFVMLLVLLLLGGTAGAVSRFVMPQMVAVPDLEGLAKTTAERRVANVDLELLVIGRENHLRIPKGAVIAQSPARGELEEGSTIEVILSQGPPKVKLPDVVGLRLAKAEKRLQKKDLFLGDVSKEYSLEPEGTVVGQDPDPAAGKLVIGTEVALVVSKGPQPLEIPDVSGLTGPKAVNKLKSAGFAPELVNAYSDSVDEGIVISTSPGAGDIIGEGSTVTVHVSIGPKFRELKMPDVRNMSLDAARSRLTSLGLRVRVERPDPCGSGNTVVETDPAAGTKVRENDVVALFVC